MASEYMKQILRSIMSADLDKGDTSETYESFKNQELVGAMRELSGMKELFGDSGQETAVSGDCPSHAKDKTLETFAIPFARRHNIPIIPIAFVSEMDELFGTVFGNIQYLTRDQNDETAISYGEKLRKLIDTLLVGAETERRIREEFAARIFMSYRKKDRKYANEVMRRIHDVEFCRDVAIWYDEFLVPGEDFNDAIRAAVEGCDIFAMKVTPNLLEPGNYVGEERNWVSGPVL